MVMNSARPRRTRSGSVGGRTFSSSSSLGTDTGAFVPVSGLPRPKMTGAQASSQRAERGRWGGSLRRSGRSYSPVRNKTALFNNANRGRYQQKAEVSTSLLDDQSVDHDLHQEFADIAGAGNYTSLALPVSYRGRRSMGTVDTSASGSTYASASTRGSEQSALGTYIAGTTEAGTHSTQSVSTKQRKSKLAKIKELQAENSELRSSAEVMKLELDQKEQIVEELASRQRDPAEDDKHVQAFLKLAAATKQQQQSMSSQQTKYTKIKTDLDKAQKDIRSLKKECSRRNDESEQLERELDDKLTEISELRKQLSQALQEVDGLTDQNEAHRTQVLQLTKDLALMKSGGDDSVGVKEQVEVFEAEIDRKKSEIESQRSKLAGETKRISQLEMELIKAKTRAAQLESERDRSLELLDKANTKLKRDLAEKSVLLEEAQKERASLREIEESQRKISTALQEAREELEEMKRQKKAATLTDEERKLALHEVEEDRERTQKNLDAMSSELEEARLRSESLEAEHMEVRRRLEDELENTRHNMGELQAALQEANERNRGLTETEAGKDISNDGSGRSYLDESDLEDLRKLNNGLELRVEIVSREKNEWELACKMAKDRVTQLSQEKDQLQHHLSEDADELRHVNAEMEGEIQLLLEERDGWRKAAEKAKLETAEVRAALSVAERSSNSSRNVGNEMYRSENEKLQAEIRRLTKDRDFWKQAAESKASYENLNGSMDLKGVQHDKDSSHSSEGDRRSVLTDSTSQQALLLQEAAEKKRNIERNPSRSWFARRTSSRSILSGVPNSAGESLDGGMDELVENLQNANVANEETIAKLRSEYVRLNSCYKEETYLNKKKIDSLLQENSAYEMKVKELEKELGRLNSGPES